MADVTLRGGLVEAMDGTPAAERDLHLSGGVVVAEAPAGAEAVDARGCLVTPGLINAHHHLFQTLTRGLAQDAPLFGWLRTLYPIWARLTPDHVACATRLGLAELALSGCATTSDHLYLFPDGVRLEDTIHAAAEVGLRFHPTRGAMSIGESEGGLPPDALVEDERAILDDCVRVIDAFHDPAPGSMCRVGVAPCSPFSVSTGLMRDAALLARDKGVRLHTHLAENDEDVAFSLERFGKRPGDYARSLGWTGEDVWHAHCVHLDASERMLFAATGTGVAHCPCSNGRLGSGVAPVRAMLDAGVPVGLGVDGSASNDRASLVDEARQALLMQRATGGAEALAHREAMALATTGGARVLGRDDVGTLAPGMRADVAVWDMSGLDAAGAWDPAALLLAGPRGVRDLWVEGRRVVEAGRVVTIDVAAEIRRARALVAALTD